MAPAAAVQPPITSTCRKFGVIVWALSTTLIFLADMPREPLAQAVAGMPPKKIGALLAVPPKESPAALAP